MNAGLEEQLENLIDEAERLGAPAVHTVLNLLLAAHRNGTHHKFAKHCCGFSSVGTVTMAAQVGHGASRQLLAEFGEVEDEFWGRDVSNSSH
ncbi:MAG TPA: hypothetical protein PLD20_08655 [Blastocatellia bacterium]|nr:hypothetical protein [Blastocatellia bacterium]HMX28061.1 hypothetical protein [Blastocatellia bacterium]HMY71276.1 hypothetical protein [Blastocatellia bacterium]HMZ17985.1 hypothetical protein [Blastocatellia bacterium]HNG31518.1 hypothetical protein [Blastocatellia bacterium]